MDFTLQAPREPVETGISFSVDPQQQPLDRAVAGSKAQRIALALGKDSPSIESVIQSLERSRDDTLYRQMMQQRQITEQSVQQQRSIIDLVNSGLPMEEMVAQATDEAFALGIPMLSPPNINIEEGYSRAIVSDLFAKDVAMPWETPGTEQIRNSVVRNGTYSTVAQELWEDLDAQTQAQGYIGSALGWASNSLVSFVRYANLSNNDKLLLGDDLDAQFAEFRAMEPTEFKEKFKARVNEIASTNIRSAKDYVELFLSWSREALTTENIVSPFLDIVDVAGFLPVTRIGKGFASSASAYGRVMSRAMSTPKLVMEKVATETGNFVTGMDLKVARRAQEMGKVNPNDTAIQDLHDNLPGALNPSKLLSGETSLNQGYFGDIVRAADTRSDELLNTLTDLARAERLSPDEINAAVKVQAAQTTDNIFKNVKSHFLNYESTFDELTQTTKIAFQLGKRDKTLFTDKNAAKLWASKYIKLRTQDYTVRELGSPETNYAKLPHKGKFYIEIVQDLDETRGFEQAIKSLNIPTDAQFNGGFINGLFDGKIGNLRSAADVVGEANMGNRLIAQQATQRLFTSLQKLVDPIRGLHRTERDQVRKMFEIMRDTPDPYNLKGIMLGTNQRGFYYKNTKDFEENFFRTFNQPPTWRQVDAFVAYRQFMDTIKLMDNLNRYRDYIRLGARDVEISFLGKDGATGLIKQKARLVDSIPFDSNKKFMIGIQRNDGSIQTVASHFVSGSLKTEINDLIAAGAKIYKGLEPSIFEYTNKKGKTMRAHYIVSMQGKVNRISLKQIDYHPGGYPIEKYPFYLKQAKFDKTTDLRYYLEDKVLLNAYTDKQGKEIASFLERARLSLKNGTTDWETIVDEHLPFVSRKQFQELFTTGGFDLDEPFVSTRSGERTIDVHNHGNLMDNRGNGLNELGDLDRAFAADRRADLSILKSEGGSKYTVETAPQLDVFATMELAARHSVDQRIMKDYITGTMQTFGRTFQDILGVPSEELWKNPVKYLNDMPYLPGADAARKGNAEAVRKALLRTMSNPTASGRFFQDMQRRVLESFAPGSKGFEIAENWLLPVIKDPAVWLRSMAFHAKLGLFNPWQILTQANTLTHILALSPSNAYSAMSSATMMQWLTMAGKDEIIKAVGKMSGKLPYGMSERMFLESFEAMKSTGWDILGHGVAQLDNALDPKMFRGKFGQFLDSGRVFFDGIERYLRLTGWNASYLEWRKANPKALLDNAAKAKIIRRAEELTVNMTSASNATWQKGVFALPLQFASYQVRLMEQILPSLVGKGRLPTKQAWQALATYSAMYGIPSGGLGAAFGVFPWQESIKEALVERGIESDDLGWFEAALDGIPSALFEQFTGMDLAFAERYGPGGYSVFRDLWNGEKSIPEVVVGPSGQIAMDVVWPAAQALYNAIDMDSNEGAFAVTEMHLLEAIRTISTVNNLYPILFHTTNWITKTGMILGETSELEGLTARSLGVVPEEINDVWIKKNVLDADSELRGTARREALKHFNRAFLPRMDAEDRAILIRKGKAALIAAGYTTRQANKVLREAMSQSTYSEKLEEDMEQLYKRHKRIPN